MGWKQIWETPPAALGVDVFKKRKSPPRREGGPPNVVHLTSYSFSELKPHAKFQNPRTTSSGRKVKQGERKKEREKRNNAVKS